MFVKKDRGEVAWQSGFPLGLSLMHGACENALGHTGQLLRADTSASKSAVTTQYH